jgi:hypothetical protein
VKMCVRRLDRKKCERAFVTYVRPRRPKRDKKRETAREQERRTSRTGRKRFSRIINDCSHTRHWS